MEHDFYAEGFDAYHCGKCESDNPYQASEDSHLSWNDGWLAAQDEEDEV